jgi:quercetin dioxygenase-like cupin family protein
MPARPLLAIIALAAWAAVPVAVRAAPPLETVTPTFSHDLPNMPGKSLIAALVTYPPGGASPAHTHAPSAFIYAYVLSGEIRSQVDGAPVRIYHPGESWYEAPGAHHAVSANASRTKPATLLAVFVVNSGEEPLVIPDRLQGARP